MYVEAYETSSSFYKSQLYKVFVISDVCNRSLYVIPFKTEMAKNQEHWLLKPSGFEKYFSKMFKMAKVVAPTVGSLRFNKWLHAKNWNRKMT